MLPAAHRLRDGADFGRTVRTGRRVGSRTLVVHLLLPTDPAADPPSAVPARVGLVVSRAVGGAVVRNRVKRRLRHLLADELEVLPGGSTTVVRALPPAAEVRADRLAADLRHCLTRLTRAAA